MFESLTITQRIIVAGLPLLGSLALLFVVVAVERSKGLAQFFKYGSIGVIATCVQLGVFYALASSILACLGGDDWAVKYFNLPSVELTSGVRAFRFSVATATGFVISNLFCWLMNRKFVFKPGKFVWYVELGLFFGAATLATVIALGLSSALIAWFGLMTTCAAIIEVLVSFFVNFFVRKFFIFKG